LLTGKLLTLIFKSLITTENIDNWLNEPHQLQEVSLAALEQFAQSYSYFQPIQYLIQRNRKTTGESDFFALPQLYPANPVLLREWWQRSKVRPQEPATEPLNSSALAEEDISLEELPLATALTGDYFASQGIQVPTDLPEEVPGKAKETEGPIEEEQAEGEKSLLVMMTFAEWLVYMQSKNQKEREEEADKKALKTMWQKQKLAAAIEEEDEEIPENVFEMAVNSISRNEELVSESLAQVYLSQGKKKQAIEVYRKLSLLNPEKKTYFAAKIENLQKDLEV